MALDEGRRKRPKRETARVRAARRRAGLGAGASATARTRREPDVPPRRSEPFDPFSSPDTARLEREQARRAGLVGRGFHPERALDLTVGPGLSSAIRGKGFDLSDVALDTAFLFGPGMLFRGVRGGRAAARAARATKRGKTPAREVPEGREVVRPHVSRGWEGRDSLPDRAREPGYLYHRADAERLPEIQRTGLRPHQPRGDNPPGVYFGNEPLQAKGLSWKSGNGAYLRVRRGDVAGLEERAFGESLVADAVPREALEYLGVDGKWHKLVPGAAKRGKPHVRERSKHPVRDTAVDVLNVPRSLKASFDLSAPFRQGLVLGSRHPRMFAREFGPMLRAAKSERGYQKIMDEITARPTFPVMERAGLQLTELTGIARREEQFMSHLAEQIPIVGRGVRASGRAYTAFLNKFRADAFDNYIRMLEPDAQSPEALKSIASWVNHATGRGSFGKAFEDAAVLLNTTFFSPRLIASRVQLLNPAYYAGLEPFARKQALRGMAQLLGGMSLTLWMAKLNGAEVGLDPRSSDFGKIKLGDTRIDIAGGFQQYIVAAARFVRGETVTSSGEVREKTRGDVAARLFRQKLAPVPAYGADFAFEEDLVGNEFDVSRDTGMLFAPLGLEGTYEAYRDSGAPAAAATLGLGGVGFSVQTYGAREKKSTKRSGRRYGKRSGSGRRYGKKKR